MLAPAANASVRRVMASKIRPEFNNLDPLSHWDYASFTYETHFTGY
jgi:hypothetical protein